MKYYLLGKSGLRVSELALGTMTFGTDWGWGADKDEARNMLDIYLDRGGNFVDTASGYTNGSSEKMLGDILGERRERIVLATKYTMNTHQGDPNAGGNHRKNMIRSVEKSLSRMKTDYIDLLYLHSWDNTTPVEEVLRAMDDLVRAGKVLYAGISDTPAWQISRMQTIADLRGWSPLIALQNEHSLIERTSERELTPMAQEMGLGIIVWSPLANGLLTGKYSREDLQQRNMESEGWSSRITMMASHGMLNERVFNIVDEVKKVADEVNAPAAHVALAWLRAQSSVTSILLGASKAGQLESNLNMLDLKLSEAQLHRLDAISAIELGFPHKYLNDPANLWGVFGGVAVERR
ncbi:aldo/keto reductase [Paenibacillus vulneris]|uniref:Aldo/keto reductase n=1 Tax=Paenibacillus vulneris TaxID=1133364 RepID=A0ABW3UPF5_9BACL|nr:aldo/keto reductase [Paenibacillus sp. OAS669]MBE1442440.1 aryl-alcohol dehydrogenase-like predicted oxidoreductase [Paenibacillus sp. OAS669]